MLPLLFSSNGMGDGLSSGVPSLDWIQKIRGAEVDESVVIAELRIGRKRPYRTLTEGLKAAHTNLMQGIPTRVILDSGIYREAVTSLRWDEGKARDTLLVIEGKGTVVWSGADEVPIEQFTREGDLWKLAWRSPLPMFHYFWGFQKAIGHRCEMVFVDGQPLFQRMLETYAIHGRGNFDGQSLRYDFLEFRNPKTLLKAGEFGVTTRPEQGDWLYLKTDKEATTIEITSRPYLIDFGAKKNLVLRNLIVEKTGNGAVADYRSPINLAANSDGHVPEQILIDRCKFRWNNGQGMRIEGNHWTLVDSEFICNGFSGLAGGKGEHWTIRNVSFNFNNWRVNRGWETSWSHGGTKLHECKNVLLDNVQAIGNLSVGVWFDIHCANIAMKDVTLVNNMTNSMWELSQGPFYGTRVLSYGGKTHDGGALMMMNAGECWLDHSIMIGKTTTGTHPLNGPFRNKGEALLLANYDRSDSHAALNQIHHMHFKITHSLIGGDSTLSRYLNTGSWPEDEKPRQYPSIRYVGENNWFWGLESAKPFAHQTSSTDWRSQIESSFESFHQFFGDSTSKMQDPQLIDPDRFDFRFAKRSALYAERAAWPQVRLAPSMVAKMKAFFDWAKWEPHHWNGLPEE